MKTRGIDLKTGLLQSVLPPTPHYNQDALSQPVDAWGARLRPIAGECYFYGRPSLLVDFYGGVIMPDYNSLKQILGKSIKGVILKNNTKDGRPAMSLFLVFSDNTSYEIYSDYSMNFTGGLDQGGMERARKYLTSPKGPMENVLDISLDDTKSS